MHRARVGALVCLLSVCLLSACAPVPASGGKTPGHSDDTGGTGDFGGASACLFDGSEGVQNADAIQAVGVLELDTGETCLGTLVGERTVVTALSCVLGVRQLDFRLGGEGTPHRVSNVPTRELELGRVENADVAVDDIAIVGLETTPSVDIPRATLLGEPLRAESCGAVPEVDVFGYGLNRGVVFARYYVSSMQERHLVITGSTEPGVDVGGPTFAWVKMPNGQRVYGIVGVHTSEKDELTFDTAVDANIDDLRADAADAGDSICVNGSMDGGACCVVHPDGFASINACRSPPASTNREPSATGAEGGSSEDESEE